ncbi:MAG TPA: hypothetical protein VMF67_14810 [Rhizomicrobium sp.]|nr:hypothetical protein [Rhizomicrobium sp.]
MKHISTMGHLYGTTDEGVTSDAGSYFNSWSERVLHSFAQGSGDFVPYAVLTLQWARRKIY